jgi:hypothetical protein
MNFGELEMHECEEKLVVIRGFEAAKTMYWLANLDHSPEMESKTLILGLGQFRLFQPAPPDGLRLWRSG